MKNRIYINGIGSISAQEIDQIFENQVTEYETNIFPALAPDFKRYIPAMQLRRMSKGIKMGLTAARSALEDAGINNPDAIITGTGQGSKIDTENFLQHMLDQKEEMLSPTSFIQSTHNTIGGQIALNLGCRGYNMTYSQNSASLESAFIDAQLYLQEGLGENVLVGGVDELSKKITTFQKLDGQVKKEEINNLELLNSRTPGTIISEGAHFFAISTEKSDTTYAELVDVAVVNFKKEESLSEAILGFLQKNDRKLKDIDLLICGNNGDSQFDHFYEGFHKNFSGVPQLAFKHLSGEYDTATGFAVALACKMFNKKTIPQVVKQNNVTYRQPGEILIYNQYLGEDHSFILLKSFEL